MLARTTLLCLALFLAGCPTDPGATDAGVTTDRGAATDAAAPDAPGPGELGGACASNRACSEGTCTTLPGGRGDLCTTGCLENAECPDALRCEAVSSDEMFCLFGPRGSGAVGAPCGADKGLGCASGICIDADLAQEIPVDTCTATCQDGTSCAPPFPVCNTMFALCLPIGSGETGGLCRHDGSCFDDNACTSLTGIGDRCTRICTDAGDCGADYLDCVDVDGTRYCVMKSNR